jgi:hypothetical protein
MIAPWHKPSDEGDTLVRRRQLAVARRVIAAALLPQGEGQLRPPRTAAWRAWLWLAWMLVVTAIYGYFMSGFGS